MLVKTMFSLAKLQHHISTMSSTAHLNQDAVPAAALQLLVEERKRLCHSIVVAVLRQSVRPPAAAAAAGPAPGVG
jgi:hypothetical protein